MITVLVELIEVDHATLEVGSGRQLLNLPNRHVFSPLVLNELALL